MKTYPSDPVSPRGLVLGLTKREYFAAMALQGYISGNKTINGKMNINQYDYASIAVITADALIDELNK